MLGQDASSPNWGFLWFSSVHSGKCYDSTSNMPWPLHSKLFPNRQLLYHPVLHILHTGNIIKKPTGTKFHQLQNTLALFLNSLKQTADHSVISDIISASVVCKILSRMKILHHTSPALWNVIKITVFIIIVNKVAHSMFKYVSHHNEFCTTLTNALTTVLYHWVIKVWRWIP